MSLVTLLLAIFFTWLACTALDSLPHALFGWIHPPGWLGWAMLAALVAWAIDDNANP